MADPIETVAGWLTAPDDAWSWWAGGVDGYYTVGPCATREEVIKEALAQGEYVITIDDEWQVAFYILEATDTKISDLVLSGDIILEVLEDDYSLATFDGLGTAVIDDLGTMLTEALHTWMAKHAVSLPPGQFAKIRNDERVFLPHPGMSND